jgi:SAM-dependent methyltransferase
VSLRREVGRRVMRAARPPLDRRHDRRGLCSVCGAQTRFSYNSWIVPPPLAEDWGEAGAASLRRRESLFCGSCGSSLRVRSLAAVLVEHYACAARSLAALVAEEPFASLRIAELNSIGAAHGVLARHPRLVYAEFPEEDLQSLSYADGSFDLLLTSDTLEHVPDWRTALRETHRVLRPGGRHVFTVPVAPGRAETAARAEVRAGEVVHHERPQYHGRGAGLFALLTRNQPDFLAYTDFGLDLADELRAVGFEAEVHGQDEELVFCAWRSSA